MAGQVEIERPVERWGDEYGIRISERELARLGIQPGEKVRAWLMPGLHPMTWRRCGSCDCDSPRIAPPSTGYSMKTCTPNAEERRSGTIS
jgi:hypothetical protein